MLHDRKDQNMNLRRDVISDLGMTISTSSSKCCRNANKAYRLRGADVKDCMKRHIKLPGSISQIHAQVLFRIPTVFL